MPIHTSHVGIAGLSLVAVLQPVLDATCNSYDPANPSTIITSLFLGVMTMIDWISRHKSK